ncbi:glycosyltransferase family 4 protein [Rhodoferax mekongensis]|uniref:Glycosyltransferase family 4 protein n=1 Tax=Rhodoferax mekongensis TaxID=3068341 RepID=A0ABZ0B318_9BURK|nr:glycosyltransferase family 4 protein [Rhodoferax sp. TBRC 17307]WNO06247.1 glycosyltransferase family 4 protein [Rhodoferax sp. TBRC 17307]
MVHNAYQHKGGEDTVMEAEVALLRSKGHEVELFTRHNDAITSMSKVAAAANTVWAKDVASDFENTVRTFRPDVVHVHNTFPLISPAIYWVVTRLRVPVIQTLHNFRLMCPQAMFLRNGKVCEDCLGTVPWRGAARGCYRGSVLQSTVLAGMVTVHRAMGTWQNKVTRYIALNEFCRGKFIEGGLPAERIAIKPNFVDFEPPAPAARQGFLFVGRLSSEKGVDVLVNAQRQLAGSTLRVAGTGPDAPLLNEVPGLTALGALQMEQVRHEMSAAMAMVLPSIWYENFPRTLVEALGCGLPVIASRIGALAELVKDGETGLLFEPGNADDLAQKMRWAMANPEAMASMGHKARKQYEAEFTAERNYQQLIEIYESAIAEVKAGLNP